MDKPDYRKFCTAEEVDAEIARRKDAVCRKVKQQAQIQSSKKDAVAAFNAQLKMVGEELDHELAVLDELGRRRSELDAMPLFARAGVADGDPEATP